MASLSPCFDTFIYDNWRRWMMQAISLILMIAALVLSWCVARAEQHGLIPPYQHPILTVKPLDTLEVKSTTRELATIALESNIITELKEKNPILLAFQIDFRPFNVAFNNSGATSTLSENDASARNPINTKKNLPSTMKATDTNTGIVFSSDTLIIYVVSRTLGSGFIVKSAHSKSNAIDVDIGNSDQKIFYFDVKTSPPNHVTEYLPSGSFQVATDRHQERQLRTVKIDSLCVGIHEVSNEQFRQFLSENKVSAGDAKKWLHWQSTFCRIKYEKDSWVVIASVYKNHPVVEVTWLGAKAFCDWLTVTEGQIYRLPTEAEWEFAARSGKSHSMLYPNSKNIMVDKDGNFDGTFDDDRTTVPVDSPLEKNAAGLFHFAGNVREWICDCYQDTFTGNSPKDCAKDVCADSLRVVRGGSWNLKAEKYARLGFRDGMHQDSSAFDIGFRVVIDHSKQ